MSESLTYFPVAFLTISSVLACIDPNFEDAGLSLGGSPFRVFRTVTLPLTMPAIANSILLLFACSLADFATPLVLAGTSVPRPPDAGLPSDNGALRPARRRGALLRAARPGALRLLPPALVGQPQELRHGLAASPARSTRPKGIGLAAEAAILGVCAVVIAFIVFLYALITMGAFTKTWGLDNSFTLDSFGIRIQPRAQGHHRHADNRLRLDAARRPHRRARRLHHAAQVVPLQRAYGDSLAAQLRAARHGRRHRVHHRLQLEPADTDGHDVDTRRGLRLPLRLGGHTLRHSVAAADRHVARGGFAEPRRFVRGDLPQRDAASSSSRPCSRA